MRADALGLFWEDLPPVKVLKVKPERHPPERTWEQPDYLPGLTEALAFDIPQYTDIELTQAYMHNEMLVFDIECYSNYFLVAFMGSISKKIVYFEFDKDGFIYDKCNFSKLQWVVTNFKLISFNGIHYDMPMLALMLAGKSTTELKYATDQIITHDIRAQDLLRTNKVKKLQANHIDIIEVCPLQASLKIYSGRIHAKRMQDLPFKPETCLSLEQITIVRWYCVNDLRNTLQLFETIRPEITLRENMTIASKQDLCSKSDAQIAEHIISKDVEILNGFRAKAPVIETGTVYKYQIPAYIQFKTPLLQSVLAKIKDADFIVGESGAIGMPQDLKDLLITIGDSKYQMGIGGLHSTEKSVSYVAGNTHLLIDRDVVSYYPRIILNLRLYPQQLGSNFLTVYQRIVQQRLAAKARGDDREANSLKIVVNGSFGKLSSPYSVLYAPDLFIQVTITGQLSLLLLIEALEIAGIKVVSGNTDGIVIYCKKEQELLVNNIVTEWERITQFETEETRYTAIYSKDVNNYIAIYEKPKKNNLAKTKGAYAPTGLSKNPTNWICVEAVIAHLTQKIPLEVTIMQCNDITKFVTVRTVKGGAVKDGEYLGKSIRWYYSTQAEGHIINALNGHQVPKSEGAKPLMDLPDSLPVDINYQWYIDEATRILTDIAFI